VSFGVGVGFGFAKIVVPVGVGVGVGVGLLFVAGPETMGFAPKGGGELLGGGATKTGVGGLLWSCRGGGEGLPRPRPLVIPFPSGNARLLRTLGSSPNYTIPTRSPINPTPKKMNAARMSSKPAPRFQLLKACVS